MCPGRVAWERVSRHHPDDVIGVLRHGHPLRVEFPSYEAAVACYHDPADQEAAKIRHSIADGRQSIVEGYDGPQDF